MGSLSVLIICGHLGSHANALRAVNRTAEAAAAYRAAAALRPGDPAVLRGMAEVLAANREPAAAAEAYEAAVGLERARGGAGPGVAAGLAGLAGLRRAAGDSAEAVRMYRAAAQMDPADGVRGSKRGRVRAGARA